MSFGNIVQVKLYSNTGAWTKALYTGKGPIVRGMPTIMAIIDGGVKPVAFPFFR